MSEPLTCSSEGCNLPAVEALFLRDQPGHVHDCVAHAHDVREWCDVVASGPIEGNVCPARICTGNHHLWTAEPTPLTPTDPEGA